MRRLTAFLMVLALIAGTMPARLSAATSDAQTDSIGRTPPRLSYAQGDVSFWRPGAQGWSPAQMNTPLAPGDELYTGHEGNLELQVGGRAYVRAWGDTQLGLANQELDYLQIKVTTGHASLDLRTIDPGRTVELDTPHAAFTIERPGYYRVDVAENRTLFITRRAGSATMTPAGGQPVTITASEEVVLEGTPTPTVQSFVAPDLDTWDRWNYARTDSLLDAMSARYVPPGVYGADDLDHNGNWRVVPEYGAVWVPEAVPVGWAPYTTGKWIWDPFYGWTWIDTAPWGWAPYHYGRWVFADGFWAWAPGPVVARPLYAPALVAFFGAPGVQVAVGSPFVSWVALSWGEPLVPWWGRPGFVGRPWWGGWGGPRVVNNVVVNRTTVVNVNTINVYRNVSVHNAVVAVPQEHFGRGFVNEARVTKVDPRQLQPVHGALHVTPDAASFTAARGAATRPPENVISRRVVATRPLASQATTPRPTAFGERSQARETNAPRETSPHATSPTRDAAVVNVPPARIVSPPARNAPAAPVQPRPPFGASSIERPRPPAPPRFEATHPQRPSAPQMSTPPQTSATPPAVVTPRQPMSPAAREQAPAVVPHQSVTPRVETSPPPHAQAPVIAPREPTPVAPREPIRSTAPVAPQPHPMAPPQGEQRMERSQPPARPLPGEPANRLYPGRSSQGGFNRSAARSSDGPVEPQPRSAVATPGRAKHEQR